ncbi:microvirus H family protein [Bacillus mojavensis]|nr:microvirus H family protein [Bacillus mojavensis]
MVNENINLAKQQHVSEFMPQMLTHARVPCQYCTNDQIKELALKVSAGVDLVHQHTHNLRHDSSRLGDTAKGISDVDTDAASGVVDVIHGIDDAVADTWNNFGTLQLFPSGQKHAKCCVP